MTEVITINYGSADMMDMERAFERVREFGGEEALDDFSYKFWKGLSRGYSKLVYTMERIITTSTAFFNEVRVEDDR